MPKFFCNRHLLSLKITWCCVFLHKHMKCNWICHCSKKKWWKAMQIAQNTQQYHQHDISIERHAEIFAHVMRSIMCVWVQTSHPKKYYKIFKSKHARRTIWWLETRFRKLASLVVVVKNLLYISSSSYYAHTVKDMMTGRYCITHTDFVLFFFA